MRTIRAAVRAWDWLTPLRLGQVEFELANTELVVDCLDALVDPWGQAESGQLTHDAYEISLSRYHRAVVAGNSVITAVPHVMMQAFRHRCIIVAKDSELHTTADLRGKRIGVTGWIDSGNTWTREILSREGIGIDDARWVAGRLTAAHPDYERTDGFAREGRIEQAPKGAVMSDMLIAGELDAVFTPFMPPGFYSPDSPWRFLHDDVRAEEISYAQQAGYVPGHHLLGFAGEGFEPEVALAVSKALTESKRIWVTARQKLADTSMWLTCDLLTEALSLPTDWDTPSFEIQAPMIERFNQIHHEQGIVARAASADEMFPTEVLK